MQAKDNKDDITVIVVDMFPHSLFDGKLPYTAVASANGKGPTPASTVDVKWPIEREAFGAPEGYAVPDVTPRVHIPDPAEIAAMEAAAEVARAVAAAAAAADAAEAAKAAALSVDVDSPDEVCAFPLFCRFGEKYFCKERRGWPS